MALTLTLTGAAGLRESRNFDRGTLSIGRAAGNDWVLSDPARLLSKTHCYIAAADGRYLLTDVSTNGVFLNGATERVPRNGQVALTDGDEIRLGDYSIAVSEAAATALPAGSGAAALAHDPLGEDPLADPFGAAPAAGFVHPIAAPPPPARRGADPFDLQDEARPGRAPDPDEDLFRGLIPADPWQGPSQADNVDAPQQAYAAPRPIAPVGFDDLDIDALLGDTPPGQAAPAPLPPPAAPLAQHAELFAAPAAAPPPRPRPPAAPRESAPRESALPAPGPPAAQAGGAGPPSAAGQLSAAAGIAAFLEGAGVPGLDPGRDPEAALRAAGEVFRALVEGLRQVLISRAALKNEMRVEQTMLRPRDNNPLKFSVTPEDAVAALLQPARPGYQPPLEAAREAARDLSSHEMAVMAGVQTALLGLLRRFEPGALERRLEPGMLGNLLPSARKARNWELFCVTYKAIAREAEDDFQAVFGREFARAYDGLMRKL